MPNELTFLDYLLCITRPYSTEVNLHENGIPKGAVLRNETMKTVHLLYTEMSVNKKESGSTILVLDHKIQMRLKYTELALCVNKMNFLALRANSVDICRRSSSDSKAV